MILVRPVSAEADSEPFPSGGRTARCRVSRYHLTHVGLLLLVFVECFAVVEHILLDVVADAEIHYRNVSRKALRLVADVEVLEIFVAVIHIVWIMVTAAQLQNVT